MIRPVPSAIQSSRPNRPRPCRQIQQADEIACTIGRELGPRVDALKVEIDEQVFRLRGIVSTYHAKQIASRAALSIADRDRFAVSNELTVRTVR